MNSFSSMHEMSHFKDQLLDDEIVRGVRNKKLTVKGKTLNWCIAVIDFAIVKRLLHVSILFGS